ncbi:hypothetical protein [Aquimarina sediminis]|uniref:hypothetical protein n=1 Tax=Aquimarina sediminis TaxID=2070536 RepID=UPI000CA01D34|nr:hypothetical protein [Aquimarina sediminis]
MIKKLPFLLAIVIVLFSCEAESFDESSSPEETIPQDTPAPAIEQDKIIDEYNETDGGLN